MILLYSTLRFYGHLISNILKIVRKEHCSVYNAIYNTVKTALEQKLFVKEANKVDFAYKKNEIIPEYTNNFLVYN